MPDNAQAVRLRVGRNVRHLRRARGWSQEQLAEQVGNTYKHIGQIERGEVNVTLDILTAIANGLAVGVAELFGPAGDGAYALAPADLDRLEDALRVVQRVRRGTLPRKRGEAD